MNLPRVLRNVSQRGTRGGARMVSTAPRTVPVNPREQDTPKNRWASVVKDAERVVGYPTSFLSLRWILNDEVANIATHIRKLIGTNHPLLETAKKLLLTNDTPTWGLIVLLISKTAGLNATFTELECDKTADILHSQRIISEVTEMIKTSHLIHTGMMNIQGQGQDVQDLHFGNKLALLSGDYLLCSSFNEVAKLRHYGVQEVISTILRDLAESEFIGLRDCNNKPIPSRPLTVQTDIQIPTELGAAPYKVHEVMGNMRAEWVLRNLLGGGTLLGKSCQSALILANHEPKLQEWGYTFGRNLALAWKAQLEKDLFQEGHNFSLVSAPVMLHLEDDPGLYTEIQKGYQDVENVDYNKIRDAVLGGRAIEKTTEIQKQFADKALDVLRNFPASESRKSLVKIVETL